MLDQKEILLRLGLALFFGALIGFERERKHWAAGLRTHTMVCVGSALIMMVSSFGFADTAKIANSVYDPSRVAAQVVSGIGFIGAGTILFLKRGIIRGLTTAAGLWTVAAIGLATGSGMYFAASATTLIALLILWGMQPLERWYFNKVTTKTLRVIVNSTNDLSATLQAFHQL
jgi:putative Mg2+ transporter-C (MgtC) family protein